MARKPSSHRPTLEILEGRALMTAGLSGLLSRQARLEAALAAIRSGVTATVDVGATLKHGQGRQAMAQQQKQIQQELKKLHQRQIRAQGTILSARSLDNTAIRIVFKQSQDRPIGNAAMYRISGLTVSKATAAPDGRSVVLTTSPQAAETYTLTMVSAPGRAASPGGVHTRGVISAKAVGSSVAQTLGVITLVGTPPVISPVSTDPLRVVSASSPSNTEVLVQFSEPMSDRALVAQYYEITPATVNVEAGRLIVKSARFQEFGTGADKVVNRSTVILTTESQNEIDYTVRVSNVVDLEGTPIAAATIVGGVRVDPATAPFQGTPPSVEVKNGVPSLVDTDGDGLTDNEEQRGWSATFRDSAGSMITRWVTSDIRLADTDGDGFTDNVENQLKLDPRDGDTDDDLLSDSQEYNEVYSNPVDADSDRDGVDDGTEFLGFKSSPNFADTDGDQIPDGVEISLGGYRNIRVADLPRPEIDVGSINLGLDVRFSESNAKESRDLETRSVSATLAQSESRSLSRQSTVALEAKLGVEAGFGDGSDEGGSFIKVTGEATAGYTFQQSEESASETQRSYENSLGTEREVSSGFTVDRTVVGAVMQAAVSLRNVSNLAYRVKNLQVTAFIQDPQDHSRLTPVATLLPDTEPDDGFALGPFVTDRGPLIFSNSTIIPSMVEALMANSSGLVFRISNYDIVNEDGRNFAFVSQDVADRTGQLTFDFGGARSLRAKVTGTPIDENLPGDETEIHRVAVASGRPINDTNGDKVINVNDRRTTFDLAGKQVGITLFDAIDSVGLTRYEARLDAKTGRYFEYEPGGTKAVSLTDDQYLSSYSTFVDAQGREKIFRIRGVSNDSIIQKYWEILTPTGVDQMTDLDGLILKADSPVSLNFVQDLDKDGLTADVEYLLRTSDSPVPISPTNATPKGRDTDGDGLDDRFESLIGWTVSTPLRTYTVYSAPNRRDSNFDSPQPGVDSDGDGVEDRLEYDGSDGNAAPTGWDDKNKNGLRDRFEVFATAGQVVGSAPSSTAIDVNQVVFAKNPNYATGTIVRVAAASGGLKAGTDYFIRRPDAGTQYSFHLTKADALADRNRVDLTANVTAVVGLYRPDLVLDPIRKDTDGDGIPDATEIIGFRITRIEDGTSLLIQGTSPLSPFSDSDTFTDGFEKFVGLDPLNGEDTDADGDGLPDVVELKGWKVGKVINAATGDIRIEGVSTSPLLQGPLTARTGKSRTDSVDTDGDGLTDYEEFFLRTDPASKDTDGDGIDDRVEFLGFSLGHKVGTAEIGIIRTDPVDADTDNDMRSDGAEAELLDVEAKRWVVRVAGSNATGSTGAATYRVFSNPLIADNDYDGLVDGLEFAAGTDPNNGNTDGDRRDDGVEVKAGTNPLAADLRVTVVVSTLSAPAGLTFDLQLNVRTPMSTGVGGLSDTPQAVFASNTVQVGRVRIRSFLGGETKVRFVDVNGNPFQTGNAPSTDNLALVYNGTKSYDPAKNGVPLNARFRVVVDNSGSGGAAKNVISNEIYVYTNNAATATYDVGDGSNGKGSYAFHGITGQVAAVDPSKIAFNQRAFSFGVADLERFSIEGYVTIYNQTDAGAVKTVFGGLEGVKAKQKDTTNNQETVVRPVFSYAEVVDQYLEEFSFTTESGQVVKLGFYYLIG